METGTERMIAHADGAVGRMIFNNPERHNAVSLDMWRAIPAIVQGFVADPAIRSIVLTGAGERAFVAGADISQFDTMRDSAAATAEYDVIANAAFDALANSPLPTIAMIKGYCFGGGVGISACCDLRVAADDAVFSIPAARLGLGYRYVDTKRLADIVGPAFAKEILFTAKRFSAEEARAMGLVNRIVERAELEDAVKVDTDHLAANAPLTVRAAKHATDAAMMAPEDRDMDAVEAAIHACFESADYAEGRAAFAAKRAPVFKGK